MKTKLALLATILAVGASLTTAASAYDTCGSSGYYVTRLVGYDHCGHPVYRQVWVEVCRPEPRQCAPRFTFNLPTPPCPPFFGGSWGGSGHHHHH